MKRILLTLAAVVVATLAPFAAQAGGEAKYLTITKAGGAEVSYPLASFRITSGAGNMYVESAGEKFTLSTANLVNMFFSDMPTAISALGVNTAVVVKNGGTFTVNLTQDAVLRVYSAEGSLVRSEKMAAGENITDLSSLPRGIYVLTINGQSVKFEKK